ncbi:MAG: ABC transporter ATP-binding protein [Alphaproteobacteria bacterium]|nr:ABC transporter ATP-binding protein [Alphaproteobacteria bacterium]
MALLEIKNLTVEFSTAHGPFRAVDNIDLTVDAGELVAIVGESGSGKSVSMLALMGLLPWTAKVTADRMALDGKELTDMPQNQRRRVAGKDMAMIFQEPMTSLNPCFTIGFQMNEIMARHLSLTRHERDKRAVELLSMVGIPSPESRLRAFPHQLSGGMSQRVMIAMMISCNPRLLIADEPTTALDVTIQAQILELLASLQQDTGMALVLITHDMGVVAEVAQRVVVQYAGQQVEAREVIDLFDTPKHPYTQALLAALPERAKTQQLPSIPGVVPGQLDRPDGCLFNPRCQYTVEACKRIPPGIQNGVRCHTPLDAKGNPTDPNGLRQDMKVSS